MNLNHDDLVTKLNILVQNFSHKRLGTQLESRKTIL